MGETPDADVEEAEVGVSAVVDEGVLLLAAPLESEEEITLPPLLSATAEARGGHGGAVAAAVVLV